MKMIFVSVYDSATEAYMRPFCAQTEGQAIRIFEDEVTRDDSDVGKHPEDYSLFVVGSFNDGTGELKGRDPVCLRRAHEIPRSYVGDLGEMDRANLNKVKEQL